MDLFVRNLFTRILVVLDDFKEVRLMLGGSVASCVTTRCPLHVPPLARCTHPLCVTGRLGFVAAEDGPVHACHRCCSVFCAHAFKEATHGPQIPTCSTCTPPYPAVTVTQKRQ
jgi:hypothetical protein